MKIRIIHIDDEQQTLDFCKTIFTKVERIEYLENFTSPEKAINFLENEKVDLIFCDMEMPEHNGLWFANNIPYNIPIVFLTAHSDFAIDAFEACALHYLVKPLTIAQVNNVVNRFDSVLFQPKIYKEQINQFYNNYLNRKNNESPTRIYINNIGKIIIIELDELIYLEGAGNYTKFYTTDGEVHTSSKNLKIYDDAMTANTSFIRIHRSYIINKKYVKQIIKDNNHQWIIEMKNKNRLEISKGKLDEILQLLH